MLVSVNRHQHQGILLLMTVDLSQHKIQTGRFLYLEELSSTAQVLSQFALAATTCTKGFFSQGKWTRRLMQKSLYSTYFYNFFMIFSLVFSFPADALIIISNATVSFCPCFAWHLATCRFGHSQSCHGQQTLTPRCLFNASRTRQLYPSITEAKSPSVCVGLCGSTTLNSVVQRVTTYIVIQT